MITLKNVAKTFNAGRPNEFHALRDVRLTVGREKITVFKGPSGSGKTTLLSLIGCMVRPTSGRIFVDGRETTSLPERFLSEMDAVVPWATLLGLIELHYPKAGNGRRPYPLAVMLRIYFLQHGISCPTPAPKRRSTTSSRCAHSPG